MRLTKQARGAPRAAGAAVLVAGLLLGACASNYDLTLMPRDSGKLAYGSARSLGNGEASVTIAIGDKTYVGNWVQVAHETSTSYVGASAWGWQGWGPYGGMERSYGDAVAKALLQSGDGGGLRCDLYGLTGGQGTGRCTDDKGLVYDVQIRSRNSK